MDDGAGGALAGVEGFADDVLPALGQHLNGDVPGDHVVFNQGAQELVFRFGGGGEAHFNFLEANPQQHMVELQLFFQAHGDHKTLVAVPQVHTAPLGGGFDVILLHPFVMAAGGGVIADAVLAGIHMTLSFSIHNRIIRFGNPPLSGPG